MANRRRYTSQKTAAVQAALELSEIANHPLTVDTNTGNWWCSCCNKSGDIVDFEILMAENKGQTITREIAEARVKTTIMLQQMRKA